MSVSIQHTSKSVQAHGQHCLPASLTIECALVLPLFFFFCVTLISFMTALKVQVRENLTLSNRARVLAVSSALTDSPLSWIDLSENQHYAYPAFIPGLSSLTIACRARVHVWDGSPIHAEHPQSDDETMVYVTNHESVYHTHADCSHLELSVFVSTTDEISSLRNDNGGRYKKCRGFPRHYSGPVYASTSGEYYYPSPNYAALTRHVRYISKNELSNPHLPKCSRCAARDAA